VTTSMTLAAALFPLAGATGAEPVIVAVSDRANDVHNTADPGLSNADHRSIDIRRLTVTDEGDTVRFTVKILRVARTPRLTQIFLVDITTDELPYSQLAIATHPLTAPPQSHDGLHHHMGIEGAATPQGFVSCHRLPISMRNGANTFWVEVPKRSQPAKHNSRSTPKQLGGPGTRTQPTANTPRTRCASLAVSTWAGLSKRPRSRDLRCPRPTMPTCGRSPTMPMSVRCETFGCATP
jgi:hypothetical protein